MIPVPFNVHEIQRASVCPHPQHNEVLEPVLRDGGKDCWLYCPKCHKTYLMSVYLVAGERQLFTSLGGHGNVIPTEEEKRWKKWSNAH